MQLDDFTFELPSHLIANHPLPKREDSKLIVSSKTQPVLHSTITKLPELLPEHTLLIVNNSKVFSSRIEAQLATGGKAELFLLSLPQGEKYAKAIAIGKPIKKLQKHRVVKISESIEAEIADFITSGEQTQFNIHFNCNATQLLAWLDENGKVPLPPYIKRQPTREDKNRYQTVYADQIGSVAAPTAGLHFSEQLIHNLKSKNISFANLTLHVGAGTFLPVKNLPSHHKMHSENFYIPKSTLNCIFDAKKNNHPIIAVGTTSFRALESLKEKALTMRYTELSKFTDTWLSTDLFIYPRSKNEIYKSWFADGIISNFHQPKSTLFMLMSALVGFDRIHEIYNSAISNEYRFFSYGDSGLYWF